MNGQGEESGVAWTIHQVADRRFRISARCGAHEQSEEYHTLHPTLFGLDVEDHAVIEEILDHLIREVGDVCRKRD